MAGGLLNLVAYGNQNLFLTGNPTKTFFKTTYAKYTNFGLQKFRIDFDGSRSLRLNEDSKFTFKMKRYAELLMDTYVVVNLPTIWSPIYPPNGKDGAWAPYEFKWIENLGTQMIKEVTISVGGQVINRYSGRYLLALMQRDYSVNKKKLYDDMTGNVTQLNDPANAHGRINTYPNAYYTTSLFGAEPSIRARKLYIPIDCWFTLSSKMAFPLVSLQYNELEIEVIFRPIRELYTIRDVTDTKNNWPYVQPNYVEPSQQLYYFLQNPPAIEISPESYLDKRTNWDADIHLISTYCFLSEEEAKVFATREQNYLIKNTYDWNFNNINGPSKVQLDNTLGMVVSWMYFFQRSDINLRNEWSNYTNWPYNYLPYQIIPAPAKGNVLVMDFYEELKKVKPNLDEKDAAIGPGLDPEDGGTNSGLFITGDYKSENQKNILQDFAILLDGNYREDLMDSGIYNYVEKWVRTSGNAPDGLYCYNFCLHTNPFDFQPSGAINLSKFNKIELEFTTFSPPIDPSAQFYTICDPDTKEVIGVNKSNWKLNDYTYDLHVLEERYNILTFVGGNCGLMYARS